MTTRVVAKPPAHRLLSIEALRGAAATAVVLSHAARHVAKAFGDRALIGVFQPGHAGVDLFFVISGFIILFVHRPDVGHPDRLPTYLRRRFTRVMPLYWVALALTLAMAAAGSGALPTVWRLLWSASLLPMPGEPFLGIAWTLQYEAIFYAVFAVLIARRPAGLAVFALWFAAIAWSGAGHRIAGLPGGLSGAYGIEFFAGMAAAYAVREGRVPSSMRVAAVGAILFAAAMACEGAGWLDGYAPHARLVYGIPAALLVAGLAASERDGKVTVPAVPSLLGDASYSIYLFQFVFIGIVWQAWLRGGLGERVPHLVLFAALASSAIVGGLLASRFVEKPLLALIRPRKAPPARQAGGRAA